MARSTIVVTDIVRAGATPITQTTADSTNKHQFTNDGNVYLEIVSTDGSSQTVVIEVNPSFTADSLVVSNLTVTVPAGATRLAGPFRVQTFRQDATGLTFVNPSVSTTLKFRAWRLVQA